MSKEFKIYTKTGDKGSTSLIGGERVPKYDDRIEAYGTVDELNAIIGLIRDQEIDKVYKDVLIEVQDRLFTMESQLAMGKKPISSQLPELNEGDVTLLEKEIDKMNEALPALSNFILPGGHSTVSYCHLGRTVCRRAERLTIKLSEIHPVDLINIQYLNRLSDYLFVLSRKLSQDLNATETPWLARL